MCYGCWERSGFARVENKKVIAAVPLIAAVYELACTGGNLHIVLDDWNIETPHVEWCSKVIDGRGVMPDDGTLHSVHQRYNDEKRRNPDSDEQFAAERACCDAFLAMTEHERASALALYDQFWAPHDDRRAEAAEASSEQSGDDRRER